MLVLLALCVGACGGGARSDATQMQPNSAGMAGSSSGEGAAQPRHLPTGDPHGTARPEDGPLTLGQRDGGASDDAPTVDADVSSTDAGDGNPSVDAGHAPNGTGGSASSSGSGGAPGATDPCAAGTSYRDDDGDGYGDAKSPTQSVHSKNGGACVAPAGYVAIKGDCYDNNAAAKPGQTQWFDHDRGDGSFDYNCDNAEDMEFTAIAGDCSTGNAPHTGWISKVPACGASALWQNEDGMGCYSPGTDPKQGCH